MHLEGLLPCAKPSSTFPILFLRPMCSVRNIGAEYKPRTEFAVTTLGSCYEPGAMQGVAQEGKSKSFLFAELALGGIDRIGPWARSNMASHRGAKPNGMMREMSPKDCRILLRAFYDSNPVPGGGDRYGSELDCWPALASPTLPAFPLCASLLV